LPRRKVATFTGAKVATYFFLKKTTEPKTKKKQRKPANPEDQGKIEHLTINRRNFSEKYIKNRAWLFHHVNNSTILDSINFIDD
jgi:hypothetical protein